MKFLGLILVVVIVGISCQSTKPTAKTAATKPTAKPSGKPSGSPTKPTFTTKAKPSKSAADAKVSGDTTKSQKVSSSVLPEFTTPKPIPNYTCNNVTGIANFNFTKYATGKWFIKGQLSAWPFSL